MAKNIYPIIKKKLPINSNLQTTIKPKSMMILATNNLISCIVIECMLGDPISIANQIKNRNKKIPKKRAIQRSMVMISFNSTYIFKGYQIYK